MVLELHIWGPAFGLPSIDPECIAAVTLLSNILREDQWTLVQQHDTSSSPSGSLPCLHDGSCRVSRFTSIQAYLASLNLIDTHLSPLQRANSTASLTAHIQHILLPLLDHHLYSLPNYTLIRTAWTHILPAHANFIHPTHRRAAAEARTATLGLSSSSSSSAPAPSQSAAERASSQARAEFEDSSPSLLFKRKQTVKETLAHQHAAEKFRLESLLDDALAPLEHALKQQQGHKFLLSDEINAIDHLAFAYLALLALPDLPDTFLRECVATQHPLIHNYITTLHATLLTSIPTPQKAKPPTLLTATKSLTSELFSSIFPRSLHFSISQDLGLGASQQRTIRRFFAYPTIFVTLAPCWIAAAYTAYFWAVRTYNPAEMVFGRQRAGLAGLGAAGAALSGLF